jgi:hypothetical protein
MTLEHSLTHTFIMSYSIFISMYIALNICGIYALIMRHVPHYKNLPINKIKIKTL